MRNDEADKPRLDALALLEGMLDRARLLALVEKFILFDDSKRGATRKSVARNHQVLGVNRAVDSVKRQEVLKKQYRISFGAGRAAAAHPPVPARRCRC